MVITHVAFSKHNQLDPQAKEKPLAVTNCGYTIFYNKLSSINHPDDNSDYLLLYQYKGSSTLYAQEQSYEVKEGYFFLLNPDERRKYTFHSSEQNTHYYVYFKGYQAYELLVKLNLANRKVFPYVSSEQMVKNYERILDDFSINGHENFLFRSVYLLNILTEISKYNKEEQQTQKTQLLPALVYMEKHYDKPLSLRQYAELCNLSPSRFSHLFQTTYNASPIEYRNTLRFNKAKHLLLNYDLSVSEIAYSLGFDSPLYFSAFFKARAGCSPLAYQQKKNKAKKTD